MDEQEERDREAYEAWRKRLVNDVAFRREVEVIAERARQGEFPPDDRTIEDRLEQHRKRPRAD